MDNEKLILVDEYIESPLKLVESVNTPAGEYSGAVLATLYGVLSDFGNETRNQRWYTGSLWRKVLSSELFKEAIATKTLFGEADHPLDVENRLETHIPYISHIIRDPKINESKQVVEGYLDVLDTPNGRIVKTLIDYGCELGVSSRGSGDLTSIGGKTVVDENTYNFITWDIIARPSNKKARVNEIDTVDSTGRTAYESLRSQIESMIENGNRSGLKLTESLVSKTDIPDKDDILKTIHESLADDSGESTKVHDEDPQDVVPKSDLDDAYNRILSLKSENSGLDIENKSLKKSLEESRKTISDLNDLNKNLSSMVSSYMEQLSDDDETSSHTMKSEESLEDDEIKEDSSSNNDDNLDISEVVSAIDANSADILDKLSEVLKKVDQSDKVKEIESDKDELAKKLDEAEAEIDKLKKQVNTSQDENVRLIRQTSAVTNEYFKVRCSQLGLDESVARREFSSRLYEYKLSDIDEVLTEMYSNGNGKSTSVINESITTGRKIGSVKLTGVPKSKYSDEDGEHDHDSLIESIRLTRNS